MRKSDHAHRWKLVACHPQRVVVRRKAASDVLRRRRRRDVGVGGFVVDRGAAADLHRAFARGGVGRGGGELDRERAAEVGLALDADAAAVLLQNLLAHGEAEARAAAALARDEHAEDAFEVFLLDAGAGVLDADAGQALLVVVAGSHLHAARVALEAGVDGVGDDVEDRAVHRFGVEHEGRHRGGGVPHELDLLVLGAGLHQLDHVGDDFVEVRRLGHRLAFLAEREHVHHEGGDAFLVALDDVPALAHRGDGLFGELDVHLAVADGLGVVLDAELDEVTTAADALQDVLDVVREGGDRLADGRQPFGLDHGLVIGGVFHRQRCLVGDGDHELQVLLRKLVGRALLQNAVGRERGVDVDHADDVVASLHRHTDRLANGELQDALRGVEPVVVAGVGREHAFVVFDDIIENRLRNGDPLVGLHAAAVATDLGHELLRLRVLEHDAAAIGVDPFKDHVHDPRQQLVDVERVAHGQGRAVHDLQIAAGPSQPGRRVLVFGRSEDLAPLGLGHGVDDPRAVVLDVAGHDVDLVGEVLELVVGHAGVEQERAAELHLVAARQLMLADLAAVDEGAVGAAEVAEDELVVTSGELDMVARNLGVVQLNCIRRSAPDGHQRIVETEARALISTLNHEERRQGGNVPR